MRHALLVVVLVGCSSGVERHAALTDANGLVEGAPVTFAGVTIGRVREVGVQAGTEAPVRVRFEVDESTTLASNVCASVGAGPSLVLDAGSAREGTFEDIPPCAIDLGNLFEGLPSLGEAAERAGAAAREVTEGFVRGAAGQDTVRDVGRALGETARELEEGVREGTGANP